MKACQKCNHVNDDNARFCSSCGQEFIQQIIELRNTSTSDEIFNFIKSNFNDFQKMVRQDFDKRKEEWKQMQSKAPISYLSPQERAYYALLDRAEIECIEAQKQYEYLKYFLVSALVPTVQDLNFNEYASAKKKFMEEVGIAIVKEPLDAMQELFLTLTQLHKSFIWLVTDQPPYK